MTAQLNHPNCDAPELDLPEEGITFEDYLLLDVQRAESVDGKVILMRPASMEHQELFGLLFSVLQVFVQRRRLGRAFAGPATMRLSTRPSGREPDFFFVASGRLHLK